MSPWGRMEGDEPGSKDIPLSMMGYRTFKT